MATFLRLVEADIEDAWLVIGMNRIRHAYLELAPRLEPYFVAGQYDDGHGVRQTYSFRRRIGPTHWLSGSPVMVDVVDAVLAGMLAGTVGGALGAGATSRTTLGVTAACLTAVVLGAVGVGRVRRIRRDYRPRFPAPPTHHD